jgi:hypothetical protein
LHPVLLLLLLVGVLLFVSWYKRAPNAQQKKIRGRALLFGGLALVFILLITGRLHPLFALLAALIPLARRVFAFAQMANVLNSFKNTVKGAQGPSAGNTSVVDTRFLRMTLDHDSGEMDGVVLEGLHTGKRLSELGFEELVGLLAGYRAEDAQSASVLETYLDRVHGDAWREASESSEHSHRGPANGKMTAGEARMVLGVGPDASRDEIIDAHRRLMQKNHPDRGGSTYLAAKINLAKEVLLST